MPTDDPLVGGVRNARSFHDCRVVFRRRGELRDLALELREPLGFALVENGVEQRGDRRDHLVVFQRSCDFFFVHGYCFPV